MEDISIWNFANSGLFIFVLGIIYRKFSQAIEKSRQDTERREQMVAQLLEENKKLTAQLNDLSRKYDEILRDIQALKRVVEHLSAGGLTILRDRLLESCRVFIERGSITLLAKDNLKDMYHFYHDILHGNGIVQEYYEMMMKLPVDDTPIVSSFRMGGGHHEN